MACTDYRQTVVWSFQHCHSWKYFLPLSAPAPGMYYKMAQNVSETLAKKGIICCKTAQKYSALGKVLMNEDEFRSNCYQLVYQYLRCHSVHRNLDTFTYKSGTVEGTPTECLQMILKYVYFHVFPTYSCIDILQLLWHFKSFLA